MISFGNILSFAMIGVIVAAALSFVTAIISPLFVLIFRKYYSTELLSMAWKCLGLSAFLGLTLACYMAGIFLTEGWATAVEIWLICLAGFLLPVFSFALRPRWLGGITASLALLAWFAFTMALIIGAADTNSDAKIAELGAGLYCSEESFGYSFTASGYTVDVFHRYGLFKKRVIHWSVVDGAPDSRQDQPAEDLKLIDRCELAISHAPR